MKSKFVFFFFFCFLFLSVTQSASAGTNGTDLGAVDADAKIPLAYSGCGGVVPSVMNAVYEQQVVDMVNTERANNGLPPLKRVTELDNAARYHAADMGQDNYFNHDSYDGAGGTSMACVWSTRVGSYYPNWNSLRENIAAGQANPNDVMYGTYGWMNSAGHRTNILSADIWEIGVGYYEVNGSTYYRYWVQDFGRRNEVYPVIINRDAASTNSRDVSIYVYGAWQDMRIKNDDGTWGAWQTFSPSFNWTINNGVGNHTVTIELRNGGTVVTASDTIYLAVAAVPTLGDVPDSITFTYSTAENRLLPVSYTVTPSDVSTGAALTWNLTTQGTWFTVTPSSGASPNSFTITPTAGAVPKSGSITVTITNPTGVGGSPKPINLLLYITNQPFPRLHLPLVMR